MKHPALNCIEDNLLLSLHPLVATPAEQQQLPALMRWRKRRQSGQPDLLAEENVDAKGLQEFAYAHPNLQHIESIYSHFLYNTDIKSTWTF